MWVLVLSPGEAPQTLAGLPLGQKRDGKGTEGGKKEAARLGGHLGEAGWTDSQSLVIPGQAKPEVPWAMRSRDMRVLRTPGPGFPMRLESSLPEASEARQAWLTPQDSSRPGDLGKSFHFLEPPSPFAAWQGCVDSGKGVQWRSWASAGHLGGAWACGHADSRPPWRTQPLAWPFQEDLAGQRVMESKSQSSCHCDWGPA